jgi:hypothetical protein
MWSLGVLGLFMTLSIYVNVDKEGSMEMLYGLIISIPLIIGGYLLLRKKSNLRRTDLN